MEVEALYSEAMANIDAGQHDDAQRLLARVLVADPKHDRAWMALGLIVPEMDRAIECLRRSIALNPSNTEAQKYLALAEDMKRRDESPVRERTHPVYEEETADADDFSTDKPAGGLPGLGRLLLEAGALTPEKLEAALEMQRKMGESGTSKRLGDLLVERRIITKEQLHHAVSEQRARFNSLFSD
jgi:tetratricopeptide (TPR) repeat protein